MDLSQWSPEGPIPQQFPVATAPGDRSG